MKRQYLYPVIVVVALLIVAYFVYPVLVPQRERENIPVGIEVGNRAPDFTLNNLAGEEVRLSDYRGKMVFLNFWATWCPPCQQEMPSIQRLYEEREGLVILAVNSGEGRMKVDIFLKMNGYQFPVLLDPDGKVTGNKYLVRGIPTTYIIDEDGIIKTRHTGYMSYQQMKQLTQGR
ncbi:MAG: redoxin domain-containing protein [Halanaerobium sp.]|nr:redoxin domain-containing protein [Halanaerobium sp.]